MTFNNLEDKAVRVIADDLKEWMDARKHPAHYDEDHALEALVRAGIRPSALGADLERLIYDAQRRNLREGSR